MPESVEGKDESEEGQGQNINNQPADMFPLALQQENDNLQTVAGHEQNNGDEGKEAAAECSVNQIGKISHRGRHDQSGKQVKEYDEPHTETTETAELGQQKQLGKIVNGGVNPTTTLR